MQITISKLWNRIIFSADVCVDQDTHGKPGSFSKGFIRWIDKVEINEPMRLCQILAIPPCRQVTSSATA